jgi:hypothetical protein
MKYVWGKMYIYPVVEDIPCMSKTEKLCVQVATASTVSWYVSYVSQETSLANSGVSFTCMTCLAALFHYRSASGYNTVDCVAKKYVLLTKPSFI